MEKHALEVRPEELDGTRQIGRNRARELELGAHPCRRVAHNLGDGLVVVVHHRCVDQGDASVDGLAHGKIKHGQIVEAIRAEDDGVCHSEIGHGALFRASVATASVTGGTSLVTRTRPGPPLPRSGTTAGAFTK